MNLARTSNTPGRTQELNVFEADDAPLRIVDMPGYGFAQAPKPKVEAWTRLIHSYLTGRPNLRRVDDLQTNDYRAMVAYGQSKLACLMFAQELQRRSEAGGWGVRPASPPSLRAQTGAGPMRRTPVRAELKCTS